MPLPILFVDEKYIPGEKQYRCEGLEKHLIEFCDLIEFRKDIHLNPEQENEGKLLYRPNEAFEGRKLILIHVSFDSPAYPEPIITKASLHHQDTIFVKFSNSKGYDSDLRNIQFNRDQHIYNYDTNGFYHFLNFYRSYGWFEFDIIASGPKTLIRREKNAKTYAENLKQELLGQTMFMPLKIIQKRDFNELLRISLNDAERILKARDHFSELRSKKEFSTLIDRLMEEVEKKVAAYKKFNSL